MIQIQIFLTDYASYNAGTQFEFGHWVDLEKFSDVDELNEYIKDHFNKCDEESPLECGSTREEVMITDFEGFPKELYSESYDINLFNYIFEYIGANEDDKVKIAFLIDQYPGDIQYAMENYEDVIFASSDDRYELFKERFPEADKADDDNQYLSIDYEGFMEDFFEEFEHDGETYLIEKEW